MKKYLYTLLFMAVALFSASALVSCGDDDDPTPDTPKGSYATGFIAISEEYFEYGTATLTIECDGQKQVINLDESKKVSKNDALAEWGANVPCREYKIPVFAFKSKPVKAYAKLELTEAGKKKLADNPDGKIKCFAHCLILAECNVDGKYLQSVDIRSNVFVLKDLLYEGFVTKFENANRLLSKEIK